MWLPSKVAKERIAKRRSTVGARIDQWPLVGTSISFFLIIAASQGTASQVHHSVVADLPLAASATLQPKASRENAIKITVTRDGMIYFRNFKVAPEDLGALIREAVHDGAERKIYLAVDGRAKYADAAAVVDQIRKAGIQNAVLLAERAPTSPRLTNAK